MLLGQARGKVGSLVFSRANGKQITRSRAEQVKNPKTMAQLIQRTFLNTASQAYSIAQAIVDHSFEGKAAGQECMSEFMKKNLEYLRARVAELIAQGNQMDEIFNFCPIGRSGLFVGPWIISNGQLPKVSLSLVPYTEIGTSKAKFAATENTYAAIIEKYNLRRGDQLTFVTVEQPLDSDQAYFNVARVILDPRNADGTAAELSVPFIADDAINLPNGKNEGNFGTLGFEGGEFIFSLTNGDIASAGIIVSRYENDSWKRSACQMIVQEDVMTDLNCYSLAMALSAASGESIDTINELYLNNAGVGGQQSSTSGQGTSPTTPVASVSNVVSFTANGATATQNVSGGSVTVAPPLTKVAISGAALDTFNLKAGTTNDAAAANALTLNAANTSAEWTGNVADNGVLYVFKNGTLWFTVTAHVNEGGGGFDEG